MVKVGLGLILVPMAIFMIVAVYAFIRDIVKACKTTKERIQVTITILLILCIVIGLGLVIAGDGFRG